MHQSDRSNMDLQERYELTVKCRDSDAIPKVENAGEVVQDANLNYQVMHNGVKVFYGGYFGEWMGNIIRELKGHHEPQEEKVFHEILKYVNPGSSMLELGAYWAYYSLWFHTAIEQAKNYMIEPDPRCLQIGQLNFKLNEKNGRFGRALIGRENGKSFLHGGISKDALDDAIPVMTVDTLFEKFEIDHLSILHSDIQGAELDMLLGATQAIENRKIDYFVVSTHSEDLHRLCLSQLKYVGYSVIAEHSPSESYSADGLIAARSPDVSQPGRIEISKLVR